MRTDLQLCPRCQVNEFTPRAAVRGVDVEQLEAHPWPALSRVAQVDICTPCGQDEAMRDFRRMPPIPPDEWPIELPEEPS